MKKVLIIGLATLLLAVLTSAFVGCTNSIPTPSEIVSKAISAHENVIKYKIVLESLVEFIEESTNKSTLNTTGFVDSVKHEMGLRFILGMEGVYNSKPFNFSSEAEAYLIDDIFYIHPVAGTRDSEIINTNAPWEKETAPTGFWETIPESYRDDLPSMVGIQNLLTQQLELLKTGELKFLETAVVEGNDCYVLEVTKSYEEVLTTVDQQLFIIFYGTPVQANYLNSMIVKHWIDKKTSQLRRVNIEMEGADGETTIKVSINMVFPEYNNQISITLPAEAATAVNKD